MPHHTQKPHKNTSEQENHTPKKNTYIDKYIKAKKSMLGANETGNPVFGALGTASTMGLHMVSGPIVGTGLGYLLDSYVFDSYPYGTIIGFILGILAGFRNVQIDAKRLEDKQNAMDTHQKKISEDKS